MKKSLTLDEKKARYLDALHDYHNGTPTMSDAQFDKLEDDIKASDPKWAPLKKTGAKIGKKVEVALEQPMPSLFKAYPEDWAAWAKKNPAKGYVAMHKLDGSALQAKVVKGKVTQLRTRGDGTNGKDISYLIPYLKFPKADGQFNALLRCEAVMQKAHYEEHYADVAGVGDSRSLVNGALNKTTALPIHKRIDVVVLGMYGKSIEDGLRLAANAGFTTVPHKLIAAPTPEFLVQERKRSLYDMDGLVMATPDFVLAYKDGDKPRKGIIAYKVNAEEDAVDVAVLDVVWQLTGRGRYVPKIRFKPTKIGGAMVTFATCHNALWMKDRKIGPGAVVRVCRSGGVIPKVLKCVTPGKFVFPAAACAFDGVHLVATSKDEHATQHVDVLNLVKFFRGMGVELFAKATCDALYEEGLAKPLDYLKAYKEGTLPCKVARVFPGEVQSQKLTAEFARVFASPHLDAVKLAAATQIFDAGIGERKLAILAKNGFKFDTPLVGDLESLTGIGGATGDLIRQGWTPWLRFVKEISSLGYKLAYVKPKKAVSGKLSGQVFAFTGFRDAAMQAAIEAAGGVVASFSSKTTTLIYGGKRSSKVEAARTKGIKVVAQEDFTC